MEPKKAKKAPLLRTKDGKPYPIPVLGSLGLLALGYRGVMAWRAKKQEVYIRKAEPQTNKDNE
jgi:hypothetical protein